MRENIGLVMRRKYKSRKKITSASIGFLLQCHRFSWHLGNSWLLRSSRSYLSHLSTASREQCLTSDGAIRPAAGMTILPRGASGQQSAHSSNHTLSHTSSSRSVMATCASYSFGKRTCIPFGPFGSVVFQLYYRGDG